LSLISKKFLGTTAIISRSRVPGSADQHVVHRIDWASLSDEEIEAIEAFARAAEKRQQTEQGARAELGTDR
jgi:hypothetical protein